MKNVRIQNIHENARFPGIIYAELIDIEQPKGKENIIVSMLSKISLGIFVLKIKD